MESDLPGLRQCEDCGDDQDLYLTTLKSNPLSAPRAIVLCQICRGRHVLEIDIALPLAVVTPRLVLGLQRLRKLDGNLSRLLRDDRAT